MSDLEDEFGEQLERAKLDAMKELAYGASHEINNPLANISARAQTLLVNEGDPERRRALDAIHQQALRAHEMISDLMLFARPPRLQPTEIDIASIVQQVVAELAVECERRQIDLAVSVAADVPAIVADGVQLGVAIKALCMNGVEALGRSGRVSVAIERGRESFATGESAQWPGNQSQKTTDPIATVAADVRITVQDDGPGIPARVRPHIFDPFFSGREAGRGLGFGLSKAWRIVTEHGGRISAQSPAEGGAMFIVELPVQAAVS
jgi:signal transduction histidine kinase